MLLLNSLVFDVTSSAAVFEAAIRVKSMYMLKS